MTDQADALRVSMEALWEDANRQGDELKDGFYALAQLQRGYDQLTPEAQSGADQVLREWLLGPDERRCYDATVFVQQNRITSAVPELTELAARYRAAGDEGSATGLELTIAELQG